MSRSSLGSSIESLKIKAKLLQKIKIRAGGNFKLKDAFELIAKSAGFKSWRNLKELFEATEHYCPRGSTAYWKVWIKDYEEAKAKHLEQACYLLPYRDHFFLCDSHYIEFLGIKMDDPDLSLVGCNWVEPKDSRAFSRLDKNVRANVANKKSR